MAVHRFVDEIQIFDGAFRFMKSSGYAKVPWSTDNTEQVVKSLHLNCDLTWVPCEDFYENEIAKKLFMQQLKFWKPCEWKYILSDDEIPVGNIASEFKKVRNSEDALCAYIRFYEPFFDKEMKCHLKYLGRKPRFHKWQPGLHYRGRHDLYYNEKGVKVADWRPRLILDEMFILHLKHMRPKERLDPQLAYERLGL